MDLAFHLARRRKTVSINQNKLQSKPCSENSLRRWVTTSSFWDLQTRSILCLLTLAYVEPTFYFMPSVLSILTSKPANWSPATEGAMATSDSQGWKETGRPSDPASYSADEKTEVQEVKTPPRLPCLPTHSYINIFFTLNLLMHRWMHLPIKLLVWHKKNSLVKSTILLVGASLSVWYTCKEPVV